MDNCRYHSGILVLGSGLAGCTTALCLADQGFAVTLVTPDELLEGGNSELAQGGIVFVTDEREMRDLEQDIYVAGHHFNNADAVSFLAENGGAALQRVLIDRLQVPFNQRGQDSGEWDLTLEGGHSRPRVLHCSDYTGRAIMLAMHQAVAEHPKIQVLTQRTCIDLLTTEHHARSLTYYYQLLNQCVGAYVLNDQTKQVETHLADFTVVATGGVGQIYLHSTNGDWAIGSGLSMASRAGVRLANLEYVQFHPTVLFHSKGNRFLITEAMRGEGARLLNHKGEAFMAGYDARGDLAPRDIVSRAIVTEMLKNDENHVWLDATGIGADLAKRFPTIYEHCLNIGLDIRREPIPVVPAAHYFCGGILVDLHGRSTLNRLYAVGEVSCTGLHGANRLASTSLLEALLWGVAAARDIGGRFAKERLDQRVTEAVTDWVSLGDEHNDDPALIAQDWATIRNTMWNYVGISRTQKRLRRAFEDLRDLSSHLHDFYRLTPLSQPLIRLFHGCQTAYIITQAALRNKRSLGCHYRED